MHMLESIKNYATVGTMRRSKLLEYLLDLTSSEAETLELLQEKPMSVQQLCTVINRDRTTAQRILKGLVERNLASRKGQRISTGGMKFHYEAVSNTELKARLHSRVDVWNKGIKSKISDL